MLNMTAHGNLGRDPELKEVGSSQVASFSIAARTGKDQTTWIDCSVWGKRADTVMQYLHKGDRVTVVGSGRIRTFDKKDGSEARALKSTFLTSRCLPNPPLTFKLNVERETRSAPRSFFYVKANHRAG